MARVVALFACLALCPSPAPAAPQPANPIPSAELVALASEYRSAVENYRANRVAEASGAVTRINRAKLKTVFVRMKTERRDGWQGDPLLWDRTLLLAAGMLHADTAIGAHKQHHDNDFQFHAAMSAAAFDASDQPLGGSSEQAGTAARRSALAIGEILLGDGALMLARAYLTTAVERFPNDARLLLTLGTLTETELATQFESPRYDDPTLLIRARAVRTALVRESAAFFDRALAADPSLDEARVRMAHLRVIEHRDREARTLLEQVVASPLTPFWGYIARLMLGGVHERSGQIDAATDLYFDALALRPDGQSAYMAIGHAAYAAGDREGAAAVLERFFARPMIPIAEDPWWDYPFGNWRDADPALNALRAEARK